MALAAPRAAGSYGRGSSEVEEPRRALALRMCSRLAAAPALNVRLCWCKWSGRSAGAAATCRFVLRASWLYESQESSGKFYENSYGSMESSTGNSNRSQSCNFVVICLDSPFLFQDDIVLGSPKKHFLFRTCQISNSGKNTKFQTKDVFPSRNTKFRALPFRGETGPQPCFTNFTRWNKSPSCD